MRFLVDANLPRKFSWFNHPEFSFVADWGDEILDNDIWLHALANQLVIISRDSDFFHRMMQANEHPKVIYIKLQQAGLKELHRYFSLYWAEILRLIPDKK